MAASDRNLTAALGLILGTVLAGCNQKPVPTPAAPPALPVKTVVVKAVVVSATPDAVLGQLTALGGKYRLDDHGRVWALSFHRCRLNDGDLEILRSLPDIQTMTLRGVSVVGGKLSVAGLKPIESLRELRRLDLSANTTFRGRLEFLAELPNLEFLDLQGTYFGDEAMQDVAKTRRLTTIQLGMMQLTERGLTDLCRSSAEQVEYWIRRDQDVSQLGGLKNLRWWFVGFGDVPVDRLSAFAGCDQLEEITIRCHGLECPVESIDALRSLKSLQKLEISGPADSEWPILAALESLPDLQALRLIGIGDRGLRQLPALASLETLDLSSSSAVSEDGLQALEKLPELRHLALRPDTTTPAGLELVSRRTRLETLVFRPNLIGKFLRVIGSSSPQTVPGFVAGDLRPVLQRTALTTLKVDGLGFGDELMTEVIAAPNLRHLTVAGLPITDSGFNQLRQLKHLRLLGIEGTGVSYGAAQALHENYHPQCRITDNWCCGCMEFRPRPSDKH